MSYVSKVVSEARRRPGNVLVAKGLRYEVSASSTYISKDQFEIAYKHCKCAWTAGLKQDSSLAASIRHCRMQKRA